jgi:cytochrome P450
MVTLLLLVLCCVIALFVLINVWSQKKVRQFKRIRGNGPAYLKSAGLIAMIKQILGLEKRDRPTVAREQYLELGVENKMYHAFLGPLSTVSICNGDLAKTVFFDTKTFARRLMVPGTILHYMTQDGFASGSEEKWKPRRAMMNPSFARLENYYPTFFKTIDECLDGWDKKLGNKSQVVVVVPDRMTRLALDVLGKTVFKYDFGALADKQDTVHEDYDILVPQSFTVFNNVFPWWWKRIPTEKNRNLKFHIERFRNSLDKIIAHARERREKETNGEEYDYPSLLETMIDAQDEDTNLKLTDAQIRDDCFGFFLAGHETTANSLSALMYALAKHPEVQQKCYEEVIRIMGTNDGSKITYEDVYKMEYLLWAIKENLRMYRSQGGATYRVATIDTVLGDFRIPKGTMLSMNSAGFHHDPHEWKDPENYRPERFSEEESANRSKFAFMPFGTGPHKCIGDNFSLLEQRLFLAKFLLRFEVSIAPGFETLRCDPVKILNSVEPDFSVILKRRK